MTIIIDQNEAKALAKTMFAGCATLVAGTLLTRRIIVKKIAKKNNENES